MVRWLANNASLMILAVLMAFLVWVVASLQQDPIVEKTLSAPVVIVASPPNDQTVLASTLPTSVTVRVRAPQSTFDSLNASSVQVAVDLSQLGIGEHTIRLEPVIRASPAELVTWRPLTASVAIAEVIAVSMPVRVILEGTPAIGYRAQPPLAEPPQVLVTGARQIIEQIEQLEVKISIEGARSSIEQTVRPTTRGRNGESFSGVVLSPTVVSVRVPLEQLSNFKDLAVRVRPVGQPAEGYAITSISVSPQVVTVFGPRETIQQLPGFIDTLEVSVAGATQDVEQRVGLNVPPNVSPIGDNVTVLVRVRIEPQQGARTVSRRVSVVGLGEGLSAKVSPLTVDIVLFGPQPTLSRLTLDNVRVEVDVTGLDVGVHQLTPKVTVPEDLSIQSMVPSAVQVEIANASR
jgi:YbbR domain-containing protein